MAEISNKTPIVFNDFFEMGLEDHLSPFLTPQSRKWGIKLTLKSSFFSTVLLILAFIFQFYPIAAPLSPLFLLGVYFFAGVPALIASIEDIARLEINIDVLMTLAAFSSVLIGSPMEGGLLLVLFDLSGSMEDAVTEKAKGAINALYKLSPSTAFLVTENGSIVERSVKDILIGSTLLIKAGEVVPLDGTVIAGASSLNLVHLTGESLPILKNVGDEVPAGAQNMEGSLTIQVLRTSADSTVERIIKLVTEAQEAKPRIEQWFDRLSKPYAMTIIGLTAFFAITLPFFASMPFFGEEGSIYRAVAFLIAASPCALIIATPMAYLSAISACAKKGVLLKGGVTLDALTSCQAVAFDKTGTLTLGSLECTGLTALNDTKTDKKTALAIAAEMEKHAIHPMADALINYGREQNVPQVDLKAFKAVPGFGLEAKVKTPEGDKQVYIGHVGFILPKLKEPEAKLLNEASHKIKETGDLLAILLIDSDVFIFQFTDTLRPHIKETLEMLKRQNLELLMLSGDHYNSVKRVAKSLGIDHFFADLRPEDKLQHVTEISHQKGLAMVGDGVNDAPALARATVGIAMGVDGSNTAIEAADVVLLHDNLEHLGWLFDQAKKTKRIVKENLLLAAGVILLATTPALLGYIPLWLAVILHEGGTVLVGLNALRLIK